MPAAKARRSRLGHVAPALGLRADALTADVLTTIYGEEDWQATIRKVDEEEEVA